MSQAPLPRGREAPVTAPPAVKSARSPLAGARMTLAGVRVTLAAFALAGVALLALAGCGESAQEKASKSVCAARADIKSRITNLQAITPSVATLPQIKAEASGIAEDLKKIKDAQGDLEPARKQKVQAATHTFEQQLKAVVSNLTSSFSVSAAATQLEAALKQLVSSYKVALEPIECT